MAMKKIPPNEQTLLSASVYINSFQRAIEEFVYNSLDAESSSIAIRVSIDENFIQVLDNGLGITKDNFPLLGNKYSTSKFVDVTTLKSAPDKYGFRGMSLASIIEISHTVKISSKFRNSEETWMKTFCNGREENISLTTTRPSKGTTVEILGFLYNLNIQRKLIDPLKELHNIKLRLEQLSLIHCNVSISLRNDAKNEVIFRINKNRDIYQTLQSLFDIQHRDLQDLQVEKNQYRIKALIGMHKEHSKKYQWVYLNGKIVFKTRLHKILNGYLTKVFNNVTNKKNKNKNIFTNENNLFNCNIPFYFIFISCPNFDFDIIHKDKRTFVEFKNWQEIDKLIEKLVKFYCGSSSMKPITNFNKDLQKKENNNETRKKVKEIMEKIMNKNTNKPKFSQLQKGIKGKHIKRKKKNKPDVSLGKIIDNKYSDNKVRQLKQPINVLRVQDPKNGKPRYKKSRSSEVQNNLKLRERKEKIKSLNNKHKKLKKDKVVKSTVDKPNALQESIVKMFCEPTDTVKKRCKEVSFEVAQFRLNNIMSSDPQEFKKIEYGNVMNNNINNYFYKEIYEFNSKNSVHKKNIEALVSHVSKNNTNKTDFKTSYDLIKPINRLDVPFSRPIIETNNYNKPYSDSYKSFVPVSSFNSHNYKYQTSVIGQNKNGPRHFITTNSRQNFLLHKQNFYPTRNGNSRKEKVRKKLNNKTVFKTALSYLNQSSKILKCTNDLNKNENIIEDDSNFLIPAVVSNKKCYRKDFRNDIHSTYSIKYANTYTINVLSESICTNYRYSKTYSMEPYNYYDTGKNDLPSLPTGYERYDNKVNENNFVISESQSYGIECLEPIHFCETVFRNNDLHDVEKEVNVNLLIKNDEVAPNILNDYGLEQSSKELTMNNNQLYSKEIDLDGLNLDVNQNIDKQIDSPEIISEKELANLKNDSQKIIKSLDRKLINENDFINVSNDMTMTKYFELKPRHKFMPKGMSPIFKNNTHKIPYDYNTSIDYFDNDIYKNFAEDILFNHEIFEPDVQNITELAAKDIKKVNNKIAKDYGDLIFNSTSLKQVKILGQVDRKFIACIIRSSSYEDGKDSEFLALFDQHAVDERVGLENNLKDYFNGSAWKSAPIDSVIKINLAKENYLYFYNYKEKFATFGLQWTFKDNEIMVYAIPKAILGKNIREVELVMKAVKRLILEQIDAIKSLRGNVSLYPKSIMDMVFSEACRYAIKFGDKLSNEDCAQLIMRLSDCKTPFQCAHGRPVMAILMELAPNNANYTINLNKIKELKKQL